MGFAPGHLNWRRRAVVCALGALALALAPVLLRRPQAATAEAQLFKFTWADQGGAIVFNMEFTSGVRGKFQDLTRQKNYVYVDYYGATGPTQNQQWELDHPLVRLVKRIYYPQQKVLRLVFYPRATDPMTISHSGFGGRFALTIEPPVPRTLAASRRARPGAKLVVIDPGHGGWHMGCQTTKTINGRTYYEKELTMQIAQRLVKLFERAPNLEFVMTRQGDEYVSLDERIAIADRAKGDLFISIHMNATDSKKKTARGFEVYSLADASAATNRELELLENEGKMPHGTGKGESADVQTILSSLVNDKMSQRRRESALVSQIFHETFSRQGPFKNMCRGAKTANFRVLMNYNMPSALVECGFLDNPDDAKNLIKPQTQEEIAILIFNAINEYFRRVDPGFTPFQSGPDTRQPSIVAAPRGKRAR